MHSLALAINAADAGPFGWLLIPSLTVFFVCITIVGIRQFLEPNHRLRKLQLRHPALVSFTLLVLVIGYAFVGVVAQNATADVFEQKKGSIAPTTLESNTLLSIPASSKATPNKAIERPSVADLEREFFDTYVPPDGCKENKIRTKDMLMECANDRGRAKRKFMAKHGVRN